MCQSDEHTPEVNNTSVPAPYAVLQHVVDVHCHPTDSPFSQDVMDGLAVRICAMATRATDQALVKQLAAAYPEKVIPCFGLWPFSTLSSCATYTVGHRPFGSPLGHACYVQGTTLGSPTGLL